MTKKVRVKEQKRRMVDPKKVYHIVARKFGLTYDDLLAYNRKNTVVQPRQMVWKILYELFDMSYQEIAVGCANRTHPTVLIGVRRITSVIRRYPGVKEDYEKLVELIRESVPNMGLHISAITLDDRNITINHSKYGRLEVQVFSDNPDAARIICESLNVNM